MVRPQVHANDPPQSHQLLDTATPSNPAPARALKRSAVPLGTRKRVRSDGDPAGADSILAAQPAGQTVASALLDSSSHHNAPSQPAAYPPTSSISLHHPVAADANNVFAMNPPTSAAQDFGGFGASYGGIGWSQISSGFYDGNLTASIAQPPFPGQSQTSYDDHFAVPQPPALTESYPPPPSAAALEGLTSLEKLSTRMLRTLGQPSFQDVLDAVNKVGSPQGKEYARLKAHFDQQFKSLSQQRPFLDAKALRLDTPPYLDIVRQVNTSAFVSSLFGGQEIPLPTLNECFLDIFVPPGGSLLEWQGSLWLELKTQAYAAAMMKRERPEDVADRLLPLDIDVELQHGRPEPKQPSPVEQDFIGKVAQRRQTLLSQQDPIQLTRKYDWTSFLKELSGATAHILKTFSGPPGASFNGQFPQTGGFPGYSPMTEAGGNSYDETITRAALVAHAALAPQAKSSDGQQNAIPFYQAYPHVAQQHTTSTQPARTSTQPGTGSPGSPAPVQSAPTQVLYDQARAASNVRAPPNSRKGGGQNQRRPWSLEEERALMDGLDRVKGPHWSQILALYGVGGTVSEILKERNQVQLKDKARNLKLFFLKSGVEVPVYLQGVTGDLKTRAPAQAAKQEALAKQRQQEEQGKLQERRAQMDAAAVLAAGAGRWAVNGGPDPFVQQNPYAGRTAAAIDPSLRIAEDSAGQQLQRAAEM
ncbi:telomere repeat binding factor-domain-containing protein [Phyllosticta capitalensis]|uniref:telomere repeat binding factor-domain-containing protein n=1 Tax=Phyllosticta capitalensis TaxID=121624 RepID=UPI003130117E